MADMVALPNLHLVREIAARGGPASETDLLSESANFVETRNPEAERNASPERIPSPGVATDDQVVDARGRPGNNSTPGRSSNRQRKKHRKEARRNDRGSESGDKPRGDQRKRNGKKKTKKKSRRNDGNSGVGLGGRNRSERNHARRPDSSDSEDFVRGGLARRSVSSRYP